MSNLTDHLRTPPKNQGINRSFLRIFYAALSACTLLAGLLSGFYLQKHSQSQSFPAILFNELSPSIRKVFRLEGPPQSAEQRQQQRSFEVKPQHFENTSPLRETQVADKRPFSTIKDEPQIWLPLSIGDQDSASNVSIQLASHQVDSTANETTTGWPVPAARSAPSQDIETQQTDHSRSFFKEDESSEHSVHQDTQIHSALTLVSAITTLQNVPLSTDDSSNPQLTQTLEFTSRFRNPSHDQLVNGDALLAAGHYRAARDLYLQILKPKVSANDGELLFRIALCEEQLGNIYPAQNTYQELQSLDISQELKSLARAGQARTWALTGRQDLAVMTLQRAALVQGDRTRAVSDLHQLGWLISHRLYQSRPTHPAVDPLLQDQTLLGPEWEISTMSLLKELRASEAKISKRPLQVGPLPKPPQRKPALVSTPVNNQGRAEIQLTFSQPTQSCLQLLQACASVTGIQFEISSDVEARLSAQSLECSFENMPLGVFLDLLVEPLGLIWFESRDVIEIKVFNFPNQSSLSAYRLNATLRYLRYVLDHVGSEMDFMSLRVDLACALFMAGDAQSAIQFLEVVSALPKHRKLQAVATFNLGKIAVFQSRPKDASLAFSRVADLANGERLEPVAYLYLGRIQLENDSPRDAITPLTRALALSIGTQFEAIAALQIASAYLMLQHYPRANAILIEHLTQLEKRPYQECAAFLSTLIHTQSSQSDHERFRNQSLLVQSLVRLNPQHCFGGHWIWLIGNACLQVGLVQDGLQHFLQCLAGHRQFALQSRMRAEILKADPTLLQKQSQSFPQTQFPSTPAQDQLNSALIQAERAIRQQHYPETLRLCREIISSKDAHPAQQRAALRLLGEMYLVQGLYEEASQCLSGLPPEINHSISDQPPERNQEVRP